MVCVAWLIFLSQAGFYAAFLPAWGGFDEPNHLGYIELIARTGRLPIYGQSHLPLEIQHSFYSLPNPTWLTPNSGRKYGDPEIPDIRPQPDSQTMPLYEAYQPPLYYVLVSGPYKLFASESVISRLYLSRFCSVILASLFIFPGLKLIREITPSTVRQTLMLFAVLLFPVLYIDVARVGNDSLGLLLYTWLCYRVVLLFKSPNTLTSTCAGIVLGLGLLTKMYFLPTLIPIAILGAVKIVNSGAQRKCILKCFALTFAVAAAISLPWFIRNYHFLGTFIPMTEMVGLSNVSLEAGLREALRIPWLRQCDVFFRSFIWVGGWNFLDLPKSVYDFFKVLFLIILVGSIRHLAKNTQRALNSIALPGIFIASFFAALMGFEVLSYMVRGVPGGHGWYVYALIVPISIISVESFKGISAKHANAWGLLLVVSLALTNIYGVFFRLLPYYTSYPPGDLSRRELARLLLLRPLENLEIMISRLTPYKPAFLTAHLYSIICFTFLTSICAAVIIPFLRIFRSDFVPDAPESPR